MKKLLLLPNLLLTLALFAQQTEGVNEEHLLLAPGEAQSKFDVKRIKLETGVALEYVEQGNANGTPVIFLHGLSDSWHSFKTVLPYLPPSVHAVALSQRGHGDSERPQQGYTPKDFAADVAAFIKEKGLGAAVIVGHSMGGVITQQFALDYPQLIKAMVIIDYDAAFGENPGMKEFYHDVTKMEGAISLEFMDAFQKGTLSKPVDPVFYQTVVAEGMKVPVSVLQAALKGIVETDLSALLKNIRCPVLILWGDKDSFCFRKGQDKLVNNLKNSKLIIYKNVGHALHWEEPKRFADDLIHFVRSLQ